MMMNPIIVTGATGSMGAVAVRKLAAEGRPVILACRDLDRGNKLMESVLREIPEAQLELYHLNLSSQASVREFVTLLQGRTFDGLFNNAGVLSRCYGKSEDGIENTMAVNYLNPSLLTRLLASQFAPGAHIVNMVSMTCKVSSIDPEWTSYGPEKFGQILTYGKSKVAMLYFTIAFARRHPELYVNVSDPGIVDSKMITLDRWFDPLTDVCFRPFINSPEKGAIPALRALKADKSLQYFVGKKSDPIPERFLNSPMPDILWDQATVLLKI